MNLDARDRRGTLILSSGRGTKRTTDYCPGQAVGVRTSGERGRGLAGRERNRIHRLRQAKSLSLRSAFPAAWRVSGLTTGATESV